MGGDTANGGWSAHDTTPEPLPEVTHYQSDDTTVFVDTSVDDEGAWIKAPTDIVLTVGGGGR